ncbi:hypothetical protein LSH36_468g04027 [Paralvinella palmiformis]|uniref:Variant-specific surface protein n=1 Tax=Paralvinella palmiformis TaxID=53620 RepID=A0AAD9JA71_9ANNE|nr:hypothetical protein LSH36_468g04027 [Paralvinella palmiformis]
MLFYRSTLFCAACPTSDQCTKCITGDRSAPAKCVSCVEGYFISSDQCVACAVSNCKWCPLGSVCDDCNDYYFNSRVNLCSQCPDNCEICTTEQTLIGGCTKCYTGYTLDLSSSSCVHCGGCTTCTWNETAGRIQCQCPTVTDNPDISIDDPYAFWGCCPSGGYACQPGYLYLGPVDSSGVSLCVACIDGCRYCNSTTGCIQCNPDRNYAVEPKEGDATCISCTMTSEACISCSGKLQIFQCDECAAGYYLEDFNCEACSENCQNCTLDDESGATFCTLCSDNYTEKNGKCEGSAANTLRRYPGKVPPSQYSGCEGATIGAGEIPAGDDFMVGRPPARSRTETRWI